MALDAASKPTAGAGRRKPRARWLELSLHVPPEFVEPVAGLFRRYGQGGVVIEEPGGFNPDLGESPPAGRGATLRTYLPAAQRFRRNRERIHIGISLISHIHPLPPLREREVAEADWEESWKAHFPPLRVGRRLAVVTPFHAYAPRPGEEVVVIDPGLAFGTGHHPTTHHCLESLQRLVTPGCRVLDVGTGSGILAIAAAKLGAGRVVGLDTDPVAVRVSRANVRANGVARVVRCYPGSLPHPRVAAGATGLLLANVHARAIIGLAPMLRDALQPGGWLVAAGVLKEQLAQVRSALAGAGLQVRDELANDDWVTFLAGRSGPESG